MKWNINRRQFLRTAAGAAAGVAAGLPAGAAAEADSTRGVAIIADPADAVASSATTAWAAGELVRALAEHGVPARIYGNAAEAPAGHLRIVAAGMASTGAAAALNAAGARAEAVPEALALCQRREDVWACGHDARGLSYALLELADRAAPRL